ncbi:MAG: hypothetical protein VX405_01805 [Myxococcota bacterium]|nr:hypothetical protein [Myxococcota bacterium]
MKWLAVFTVALSLGGLGALAINPADSPEPTAPVVPPSQRLSLPSAPFADWLPLGWSQDVTGRWIASGYRMDSRGVDQLVDVVMRYWTQKGRGGRVVPLEEGGAFLSSVDLSSGDQVTYLIEDRGDTRTLLVGRTDFAARPSQGREHVGPALGGLASGTTQSVTQGFNQAVEARRATLRGAGWTAIQSSGDEERAQGSHSETWKRDHQLIQVDHVKGADGQVMSREQTLPSHEVAP